MGEGGGVSVVRGAPARGGSGVVGAAGVVRRLLLGAAPWAKKGLRAHASGGVWARRGRAQRGRGRPRQLARACRHRGRRVGRVRGERRRDWGGAGGGTLGAPLISSKRRPRRLPKAGGGGGEVVESRGLAYWGGGYAGTDGWRNAGRARGGGRLTDTRG